MKTPQLNQIRDRTRFVIECLERRAYRAIDLAVTAITPDNPNFNQDETVSPYGTSFNYHLTVRNSGTTEFSYVTDTAGGSIILSRDKIVGNSDDITMIGGWGVVEAPAKMSTAISGATVPPGRLDPGLYYMATVFQWMEFGGDVKTQVFVTSTPVLGVLASVLPTREIFGTTGNDTIVIGDSAAGAYAWLNGIPYGLPNPDAGIFVDGRAGNDKIATLGTVHLPLHITGGGGNDTIVGGSGSDELSGANGRDKIFGGPGYDYLLGGAGNDYLTGQVGNDTMSGAGGNDRLIDDSGSNYLLGGAGNDVILSRSLAGSLSDTLSGNSGLDQGQFDDDDLRAGIENILQ